MYSLRPHKRIDFARYWKLGFKISGALIALAIVGFVVSTIVTGAPLTLGTEFSGGTSIQINDAGDVTEDQLRDAFVSAASGLGYDTQISSIQSATTMAGGNGYIVKTTDTVSTNASEIMSYVENALGIDETTVEIETIGASWGASVIWSSLVAFFLSCLGILVVIALRYREPRMGVVALICLFHDMIVVLGIYAWAGMFFHMEITSDVIAALLAIIGYSLYDTVVVFHRVNRNASPSMKCSLKTCANMSLNEVIVRSINTSITSILPVLIMLILGTDTLLAFAFAMFIGMIVGFYSTLAISAPIYTMWKAKEPAYARLEEKYPYEVVQSPYTKEMMLEDRKKTVEELKERKEERKQLKAEDRAAAKEAKEAERQARVDAEKAARDAQAAEAKRVADEENSAFVTLDLDESGASVAELFNSDSTTSVDFEDLVSVPDDDEHRAEAADSDAKAEPKVEPEETIEIELEDAADVDDEDSIVTTSVSISFDVDDADEPDAASDDDGAGAGDDDASDETEDDASRD